ncbi:080L [Cherax quadricarinatus iridovirus]|uniref:NUDIX family protein n=1 Tax=Shrimp hemocyte iridescent virus TaxID=2039780 RepID=A0A291B0S1_9VIRU|nr:MutT/NUDIX hydrolase [Cherax quadricarinatus iridovirus]YP_010084824.1 MutT/NUDIX hydrolase [Shrimp hemocyte iridescent virus]UPA43394.1 NUDIX family protein [Iridovirus CN01]ASZ85060.1 080L [Cherax quadricarinatus iridovirus]ATE87081.1 NUDIX family protein [Shrimp hemocyte iridescent virus]UPA43470.1 NUDIX family protein [Iridovirus CN01]UPA43665.1 NUDIX family protein [Iridovirus CN01]
MALCKCCTFYTWNYIKSNEWVGFSEERRMKAGGIILHNGKILIVQTREKKWGFPKGGIETSENVIKCAEREVLEETSLSLSFEDSNKIRISDVTFYVKYLNEDPPDLNLGMIKNPGNDCTGIGWIRLGCLKKMVEKSNSHSDPVLNRSIRMFMKKYAYFF